MFKNMEHDIGRGRGDKEEHNLDAQNTNLPYILMLYSFHFVILQTRVGLKK